MFKPAIPEMKAMTLKAVRDILSPRCFLPAAWHFVEDAEQDVQLVVGVADYEMLAVFTAHFERGAACGHISDIYHCWTFRHLISPFNRAFR